MDIGTLIARAEISDLLALYCRGVDRVDEATLRSIYHDDAIEDRGEGLFIGNAQEWVTWTLGLLPAFSMTQHNIQNSILEIQGERAQGETYFIAYHRFGSPQGKHAAEKLAAEVTTEDVEWPEGEVELLLAGRYLDRFEHRNGKWKFAYRKMICDWCRTQPAADDWFRQNPTAYLGKRNIEDSRLPI